MPTNTDRPELLDLGSPGVEQVDGTVRLTFWTDPLYTAGAIRIRLQPGEALELLRNLANATTYAVTNAAQAIATGDCARCRNTRLVDDPDSHVGHNMRCPDCGPQWEAAHSGSFPAYPRVGGGIE